MLRPDVLCHLLKVHGDCKAIRTDVRAMQARCAQLTKELKQILAKQTGKK